MVIELVKSIEKRIQRKLRRARMAGQSPGGFWPDPHQDIRDLAATLEAVNRKQGLIKLLIEDDIHFAADREDMMELIGNLLDNACKWAKRRVYLNISSTDGLEISVDDDGPGMDENRKHEILSRGGRADESMQGHGLGLAIVQDIVKAYHGALHIGHSDSLGGLRVSVTLPDPATIVRQQKN
jgi:signal transduction histidine kinase